MNHVRGTRTYSGPEGHTGHSFGDRTYVTLLRYAYIDLDMGSS